MHERHDDTSKQSIENPLTPKLNSSFFPNSHFREAELTAATTNKSSTKKNFLLRQKTLTTLGAFTLTIIAAARSVISEHLPVGEARAPTPVSKQLVNRLEIPVFQVSPNTTIEHETYTLYTGHLTIEEEDHDYSLYFPKNMDEDLPFTNVIPMLENMTSITSGVCEEFAENGYVAGMLNRSISFFEPGSKVIDVEKKLINAIGQQRAFIEMASNLEGIDSSKMTCVGISMGGILGVMLGAVEPRINALGVIVAGGDFPTLMSKSSQSMVRKWADALMEENNWSEQDLENELEHLLDPNDFARALERDDILFAQALYDWVIPEQSYSSMYDALGKPYTLKIHLGHYTTALVLQPLARKTIRFFDKKLREDESEDLKELIAQKE